MEKRVGLVAMVNTIMSRNHIRWASLFAAMAFTWNAQAVLITYNTSDSQFTPNVDNQGWWSGVIANGDANDNYFVGNQGSGEIRNFFTFDLSNLSGTVVGATLELTRYSYDSSAPSETYGLFDVSTAAVTLNNNNGTSAPIFADLGSGTSYGSFVVSSYSFSSSLLLSFSLNSAALSAINSAGGGFFSIGGSLLSLDGTTLNGFEGILTSSSGSGIQRLVLDVQPVPEPSTFSLIALGGLSMLGVARRLRK